MKLSASGMCKFNVAVNDAICKIFSFNCCESVRTFRAGLGYPDLYKIFADCHSSFLKGLLIFYNHVLNLIGNFGL